MNGENFQKILYKIRKDWFLSQFLEGFAGQSKQKAIHCVNGVWKERYRGRLELSKLNNIYENCQNWITPDPFDFDSPWHSLLDKL